MSSLVLLLFACAAWPMAAKEGVVEIQPIAPWERVAVELAVAYAESGASAWWNRLAADSPLAALGRQRAVAEIAVRAGPSAGAFWQLQTLIADSKEPPTAPEGERRGRQVAVFALQYPSGLDEALVLELVETGGEWRLFDLRSWAEAPALAKAGDASLEAPAEVDPAQPERQAAKSPVVTPWQRVFGPLVGMVLLIVAASLRRRSRILGWLLLVLGIASILLSIFLPGPISWTMPIPWAEPNSPPGPQPDSEVGGAGSEEGLTDGDSLVALAPLRSALTTLAPRDEIDRLFARVTGALAPEGPVMATARLWRAQFELAEGNLPAADALLAELPSPCTQPLGDLLRGRLGVIRGEGVDAVFGYERAIAALPDFDGLLLEAGEAFVATGFDKRAAGLFDRLAASGSRQARIYDRLIDQAAIGGDEEEALGFFNTAWRLQPAERSQLLADPVRSFLVRRYGLFSMLDLAQPSEPAPVSAENAQAARLEIPESFVATYSGQSLLLWRGTTQVEIPGGLSLAPAAAEAEDASRRRLHIEERVLGDWMAPELAAGAGRVSAIRDLPPLGQPVRRAQMEMAASVLARDHRWDELLDLTAPFAALAVPLPPSVGALRAEALRRAGKVEEATRLVVSIAKSNVAAGRKAPYSLFQLARLLTEVEEWDYAIRAVQTAEEQMLEAPLVSMIPRIQMEKRLAEGYEIHRSRHFEVRYPRGTSRYFVEQLTEVLEKETARLQEWIPFAPHEPIEVHLFPFHEFFRLYSQGGAVVGLFDGKVRVPMAEVQRLSPAVVAILSHELAHALITGATGDRAPAWFHEGLAQHVQMLQGQVNPIPDYLRQGKLVAFPLLDPILDGRSDAQLVQLAYDEARWALHYFEVRHGRRSIHRLLKAFERRRSTEQAIAEVTGMTVVQLDAAMWDWAKGRKSWETEVVRYDR